MEERIKTLENAVAEIFVELAGMRSAVSSMAEDNRKLINRVEKLSMDNRKLKEAMVSSLEGIALVQGVTAGLAKNAGMSELEFMGLLQESASVLEAHVEEKRNGGDDRELAANFIMAMVGGDDG